MTSEFLRGNVIRIFDPQRLLVNLGMLHGVKLGERFYVYEEGEELIDPSNSLPLGRLELVKAELEAVMVQEKMSLLMPLRKAQYDQTTVLSATLARTYTGGTQGSDLARDQLNVRNEQVIGLKQVNPIAIGDKVRSAVTVGE